MDFLIIPIAYALYLFLLVFHDLTLLSGQGLAAFGGQVSP